MHIAIVDAVNQDQQHFDDKHDAEKIGQAAKAFLTGALKTNVIKSVHPDAKKKEDWDKYHTNNNWIESKIVIYIKSDVRPDDHKSGVSDINDIKSPKYNGEAKRDRGIKSA